MLTFEVKGRDPKFTWEIVGIYRAPNEDMLVILGVQLKTGPLTKPLIFHVRCYL